MTKTTPATHVPEILQQNLFINIFTKPEGGYMSNFMRQNDVNMSNEPLEFEQPVTKFRESSSEMDKLPWFTNTDHFPDTIITVMGTRFPAREF